MDISSLDFLTDEVYITISKICKNIETEHHVFEGLQILRFAQIRMRALQTAVQSTMIVGNKDYLWTATFIRAKWKKCCLKIWTRRKNKKEWRNLIEGPENRSTKYNKKLNGHWMCLKNGVYSVNSDNSQDDDQKRLARKTSFHFRLDLNNCKWN